jgi:4-amino-4-deoxy-L-arabinose transferase-like glycosyltransferase
VSTPPQPGPPSFRNHPPAWAIFALTFAAVFLAHWPLLRLPYYWDEAGYYIPAAFDFFRTGSLIPFSTLSNAHPPLPSIYLALCWKLFGFHPFVTRSAMCVIAALALTAVWRIAMIATHRRTVALATLALTAIYPVFFVQSSLAHADLFAAAATLWGLAFFLEGRRFWPVIACFCLAALSKETAIVTPLALAAWQGLLALRTRAAKNARTAALLTIPVLPLAFWYLYHWHRTGFVFGNAQYLHYNATTTLTPLRVLIALWHRASQITLHMNLFVPVLLALACLLLDPVRSAEDSAPPPLSREVRSVFCVVILANIAFFSIIGGALLTRYLLPLYPLVILLCVHTFRARLKPWPWLAAFWGVAFAGALFVNPPYKFAPEDNLAYASAIRLQQDAISRILTRYPNETVLTAWPASDELTKPELGYVDHPVPVMPIDNFSWEQIQRAVQPEKPYSVGLIFSTKYVPPRGSLDLGRSSARLDARFFGFHYDLDPATIAHLLDGQVIWREQRGGQWVAVLQFNRPQQARLALR